MSKATIKDIHVQDMLDFFGKLPPATPVRIEDNDTGYLIDTWHMEIKDGVLIISSDYSEMEKR